MWKNVGIHIRCLLLYVLVLSLFLRLYFPRPRPCDNIKWPQLTASPAAMFLVEGHSWVCSQFGLCNFLKMIHIRSKTRKVRNNQFHIFRLIIPRRRVALVFLLLVLAGGTENNLTRSGTHYNFVSIEILFLRTLNNYFSYVRLRCDLSSTWIF